MYDPRIKHIKDKLYAGLHLTKKEAMEYMLLKTKPYLYHINRYGYQKELICDRANSFGSYSHPSCFKNEADNLVVIYHACPSDEGWYDIDVLLLCNECLSDLRVGSEWQSFKLSASDKKRIIEASR